MKIKLIIDFQAKESLSIIDYFFEYRRSNNLDLEIHGYDVNETHSINNAYYGLYYANKFGVGLEYAHRILKALYEDNKDINNLDVLATSYSEIGFNCNDLIDAIMEGDYVEMHQYYQSVFKKEEINKPCYAYIYDPDKHLLVGYQDIKNYIENKKSS